MNGQARTRVGIIGAGNIAAIAQLPTLVKRDDVELAALVSRRPDPGPLMRRWGFGAAYGTVEDMLDGRRPGRGLRADSPLGACARRRRLPAARRRRVLREAARAVRRRGGAPGRPRRPARPHPDGRLQPPLRPGLRGRARDLRVGRRHLLRRPEEPARVGIPGDVRERHPHGRPAALVLRRRGRRGDRAQPRATTRGRRTGPQRSSASTPATPAC